jgi:CPA1 family monovalent cation:H+ antiporter
VHIAIWLVCLVATVVAVTALCRRLDLSAPVVLVAVGVIASYLPFVPEVRLTAEIVLVGLLPPLLYNAALQTSLIDFNAFRPVILSLSVGLVVFTTVGVALVVHLVLPGADWPSSFAIGAVVAPPDAVAATAVARRIGLPRGIVTILEGESLLNDATALVALKTAIVASAAAVSVLGVGLDFLRTALGGVLAGVLVYVVVGKVRTHVTDPVLDTSVSVVTPFTAYVAAEAIHASGVVAVVVAGLLLGHRAPMIQTASSRIAERLNWRTVSFLLENSVFLLIGLQTSRILDEVRSSSLSTGTIAFSCAAVLVAVVLLRMAWVFPSRLVLNRTAFRTGHHPPWTYTAVIGWAGMRGVVTLAAAFAIPDRATHREVLVLIALAVTAGTLVFQGLSLPWLVRRLRVPAPDPREEALIRAELLQQASQAGRARLDEIETEDDEQDASVRDLLRSRLEQRDFAAWERLGVNHPDAETPSERYSRLRLDMLRAERGRVLELRDQGGAPHEVVAEVLATLDLEESMINLRVERQQRLADKAGMAKRILDACTHLTHAGHGQEPTDRRCEDCVREGTTWVHLRTCLTCGHIGCCDSSPRRHATLHFDTTEHPVIQSAEPGESWRWCFVDELLG